MKQYIFRYSACIISLLLGLGTLSAQKVAVPVNTYGIWDRGNAIKDYSDPKYDYVMGIETSENWSEIQSKKGSGFDFSTFQDAIDTALKYNKILKMSIGVGPYCPDWLYDNGVPRVIVKSHKPYKHKKFGDYPYYLSDAYKNYYFELIKQFSLFLRNQPKEKFDRIAFVQVKTGATGDEAPYKGRPKEEKYEISKKTFEKFRLETFAQFKKYFNDVDNRQIVLTFNNLDPKKHKDAYNWVMSVIDPEIGFGIKGGAHNRGHHLSNEKSFKKQWVPFLVNPKGMKLFSASEIDQSWQKPLFAINTELGFYWAALSAINTGLSSSNVTSTAIKYATKHEEIRDVFKMYNKYAQQVYPNTATAAMSVFHEGLDAADEEKFPESIYGKASKSNLERYTKITEAYKPRGAEMNDLELVTQGQVNQREKQTGYNDAGWDIEDGNYERFLYQIKPNETSIGLFRVRGKIDTKSSKYDRFARSFENSSNKNTMYFRFHKEMFATSKPKNLRFTITWLDKTKGSTWALKYNDGKQIKCAIEVRGKGDNKWKSVVVKIKDMELNFKGELGSDFTLVNTDKVDDIFNGIEVDIKRN